MRSPILPAVLLLAAAALTAATYVPGTPGGPWTQDELLAVRAKLYSMYRVRSAPKALRLAFHDCLRYADGTGGCDGCLNWEGVGVRFKIEKFAKDHDDVHRSNNNGLEGVVEDLEKLYTMTNYPYGTPLLSESLKESGKSRADLWAYAAIVAVEFGMEMNNVACEDHTDPRVIQLTCMHQEGEEGCKIRPERPLTFQYGRADCVEHDATDAYKTTKEESHPLVIGNGKDTIDFFKADFGFNGRETAAIFGAHTYGKPSVAISLFPYTWTSSNIFVFNNDYYKNIVGQDRWFINDKQCTLVGDAYGNKPKTRWLAHTRKLTKNGGPTMWIHQNHVCPNQNLSPNDACFKDLEEGLVCNPDPTADGSPRADGEADGNINAGCERFRLISGKDEIALNCEMGLYREFEVTDGVLHGCEGLEHFNASMASDQKKAVWSKVDNKNGEPLCEKQRLAEPPGSTPLYKIMEEFADDQDAWINAYIPAMEKMMRNGYESLDEAPSLPDNLECPLPLQGTRAPTLCYVRSEPGDGPSFMIGSRLPSLDGKVYQYNTETGLFDFAASDGGQNQLWRMSQSGTQLINVHTGKPLAVDANVEWSVEETDGGSSYMVRSTLSGRYIDCARAGKTEGAECRTENKSSRTKQMFYMIESA